MFDGTTPPQSGRLNLAIVSTYDEMCGIAGYTRALEQQLRPFADVTVFDLDQYLLRSPHARVQRLADRYIKDVAARLRNFDSVNIQLEYGTLGRTSDQIIRRLKRLVRASRSLSVTFHTILGHEPLDWRAIRRAILRLRVTEAARIVGSFRRNRDLGSSTYRILHARQRRNPVNIIVHTRRDARLLHDVFRLSNVEHHPLSFVSADQAQRLRQNASSAQFPILTTLPPDAKLIGSFGFLSPYKGYETAVRALHYLPPSHHLLIFGGIHPQAIKREQPIDPYIARLLDHSHIGQSLLDTISDRGTSLTFNLDTVSKDLLIRHPEDLQHRVHFLGVHDDEAFMRAMALCDVVVLPYLEVGQSSSGPISMAVEMGCRVLASRTLAFMQFARYHPDQVEFFDIGNYAQLADLIRAGTPAPGPARQLAFNTETNTALYLRAAQPQSSIFRPSPPPGAPPEWTRSQGERVPGGVA